MADDSASLHESLDPSQVHFGPDVRYASRQLWYLDQIRPFLEDPDAEGPSIVAHQYFQVIRQGDEALLRDLRLVYHIVEIVPGILSREWASIPGQLIRGPRRTPLPTVMEVMHGEAKLVLQKFGTFGRLFDAYIVPVQQGDRLLLPPGYVFSLSNCGQEVFVAASVRSIHAVASFDEVARHRGAAYYLGPDGARPNPHYGTIAPLRELQASVMSPMPLGSRDLYHALVTTPDRFRFLDPR